MGDSARPSDDVDLTSEERSEIDGMYLRLATSNHYELLGAPMNGDRRTLRDAYFGMSQRFHPDAWFHRKLGAWKPRIEAIFRDVTHAYDVLSNKNTRADYDAKLGLSPDRALTTAPRSDPAPQRTASGTQPAASPPPTAPTPRPPVDPNAPIIPDRTTPQVQRIEPVRSTSAPVKVDHEAALRASREILARKLGRQSGSMGAMRMPDGTPSVEPANTNVNPIAVMQASRVSREEAEKQAKTAHFIKIGEESLARNDLIGAANSFQLACAMSPEDAALRARADEIIARSSAVLAERYIESARQLERSNRWDAAADMWCKALAGRPKDLTIMVRAATCLLRAKKELPKAADLARRATQLAPKSIEAFTLLADVYIASGMKASAQAAIDAASKLDPTSATVKDLQTRLKG